MVTAENDDGIQVSRNSSFIKSMPIEGREWHYREARRDSSDVAAPMQSDLAPLKRYP